MVTAFWRHGARTSSKNVFKIDQGKTLDKKDISGNGERMLYILGQQLSKYEYPELFNSIESRRYQIYSTQSERTMLSALSLAMGLFPLGTGPETTPASAPIEDNLKIQLPPWKGINKDLIPKDRKALPQGALPIPVVSVSSKNDEIFNRGMDHICPGAYKRQQKITENNLKKSAHLFDKSVKKDLDGKFKLADYYPDYAKVKKDWDLLTIGEFTDELRSYYSYMGEYPPKVDNFSWKLKYIYGIYMIKYDYTDEKTLKFYTDGLSRMLISELDERISEVSKKVKKKKRLNFLGLSAHESNILPFLMGYKLTSMECMLKILNNGKDKSHSSLSDKDICIPSPDFASNFIWELSTQKGIKSKHKHDPAYHYIRVLYNGEPLTTHCPKEHLVDGEYCPYTAFREAEKERFWFKDSNEKYYACHDLEAPLPHLQWKKFGFILIGVFVIQIIIIIFMAMKKTKDYDDLLSQNLSMEIDSQQKDLEYSDL